MTDMTEEAREVFSRKAKNRLKDCIEKDNLCDKCYFFEENENRCNASDEKWKCGGKS